MLGKMAVRKRATFLINGKTPAALASHTADS